MLSLNPNCTHGALVEELADNHWRLSIPAGTDGVYRLAQLDDYTSLSRNDFPRRPPLRMQMMCRASDADLPGTWGFGLWNDPFSLSMGFGGGARRLPALPNAAWFFFASPPNHLSLYDDQPGFGQLAAAIRSPRIPSLVLAPAVLALPMLAWRVTARWLRSAVRVFIKQEANQMQLDATSWHSYNLDWGIDRVRMLVDDHLILDTSYVPSGPLGLVIWLDNQFAALPPDGRLGYGTLANPACWIEIKDFDIQQIAV